MSLWVNTWRGLPKCSLAHHMAPPMAKPMNSMAQRSWRKNQFFQRAVRGAGAGATCSPGLGFRAGDGWLA
jgi:hypothetical protein